LDLIPKTIEKTTAIGYNMLRDDRAEYKSCPTLDFSACSKYAEGKSE